MTPNDRTPWRGEDGRGESAAFGISGLRRVCVCTSCKGYNYEKHTHTHTVTNAERTTRVRYVLAAARGHLSFSVVHDSSNNTALMKQVLHTDRCSYKI